MLLYSFRIEWSESLGQQRCCFENAFLASFSLLGLHLRGKWKPYFMQGCQLTKSLSLVSAKFRFRFAQMHSNFKILASLAFRAPPTINVRSNKSPGWAASREREKGGGGEWVTEGGPKCKSSNLVKSKNLVQRKKSLRKSKKKPLELPWEVKRNLVKWKKPLQNRRTLVKSKKPCEIERNLTISKETL